MVVHQSKTNEKNRSGSPDSRTSASTFSVSNTSSNYYKNLGIDKELFGYSPKIVSDLISLHYRILQRYFHPDNQETGNTKTANILARSFEYVEDPENFEEIKLRYNKPSKKTKTIYSNHENVKRKEDEERILLNKLREIYICQSTKNTLSIKNILNSHIKLIQLKHREAIIRKIFLSDIPKNKNYDYDKYLLANSEGKIFETTRCININSKAEIEVLNPVFTDEKPPTLKKIEKISLPKNKTKILGAIKSFATSNSQFKNIIDYSDSGCFSKEVLKEFSEFYTPLLQTNDFLLIEKTLPNGTNTYQIAGRIISVEKNTDKEKNNKNNLTPFLKSISKGNKRWISNFTSSSKVYCFEITPKETPFATLGIGEFTAKFPLDILKEVIHEHYKYFSKKIENDFKRHYPFLFDDNGNLKEKSQIENFSSIQLDAYRKFISNLAVLSNAYNEINPFQQSKEQNILKYRKFITDVKTRKEETEKNDIEIQRLFEEIEKIRDKIFKFIVKSSINENEGMHILNAENKTIEILPLVSSSPLLEIYDDKNKKEIKIGISTNIEKETSNKKTRTIQDKHIVGVIKKDLIDKEICLGLFLKNNNLILNNKDFVLPNATASSQNKVNYPHGIKLPLTDNEFEKFLSPNIENGDFLVSCVTGKPSYYIIEGIVKNIK